MNRRLLGVILAAVLLLGACASDGDSAPDGTKDSVKIGAVTIVSHPSLDLIYDGIVEGLADAGYVEGKNFEIRLENPQGDQSTLSNIANSYASGDEDLYVSIATPPTQALAQVITKKPIVFASVTDPVAAGLVESMDKPGGNVTGTSDQIPPAEQIKVLQEIDPGIASIGIVCSSSEVNSEVQAKGAKEAAEAAGLTVKTATIINSSEVQQAAESLDVDAYWVGNDNTVVSAIESLIQVAEAKQRFVFTSDADSVERGAGASYATDYKAQGVQTAGIIVNILEGAKPEEVPVEIQQSLELTINPDAAKRMGVTFPKTILDKADKTV